MGIVHDFSIAANEDEFTEIRFLSSSFITDAFQIFCDIQVCGTTGTNYARDTSTYSLMNGFSDMKNRSEGTCTSYPYKSASPYIIS